MFYTYLCLYKCTRLSLGGREKLEIYPTRKTQMILGTNGAGKSSLLKIGFSVVPSVKDDFLVDGYKIVRVNRNGHHYELTFRRTAKAAEHTFVIDDGENLNAGKTLAVQRELVKEHFGMTQELHDLLVGKRIFTDLGPQDRRDLIAQLSATDFSYVIGLYNKTRKGAKAANAVVKRSTDRLTQETGKLLTQEDIAALERRSKEVRGELNLLLQELRDEKDANWQALEDTLRNKLKVLDAEAARIAATPLYPPEGYHWQSMDALKADILERSQQIKHLEGALNSLGEEYQHYEHEMQNLKKIEGYDEAFLRKQITELEAEATDCLSYVTAGLPVHRVDRGFSVRQDLLDFMALITDTEARGGDRFSERIVRDNRIALAELQEQLSTVNRKLGNIEGRLQHISSCEEVSCPKCSTIFKPGVKDNEQERLGSAQTKGHQLAAGLKERIKTHSAFLAEAQTYQERVSLLYHFRQQHPSLTGFWELVDRSGGLEGGYELMTLVQLYLKDVEYALKLDRIDEKLAPLKEALATIARVSGEGSTIRERYYILKARIEEISSSLVTVRRELDLIERYRDQELHYDSLVAKLSEEYAGVQEILDSLVEAIRQDELHAVVRKHQGTLAIVETALTESEIQYGIVKDIEKEIAKMSLEEQAYRLLEKLLSPADGLIAEQISVFINAMIERVNAVIARIWGYNLALKPCNLDEGDLDYRFPLYAEKADNSISDIKDGSDSQRDIVNQAFRLIIYKFMRLQHFPLYLDELGRTFDPVHRVNLIPAIKDLIDDDTYGQVFIISHYLDSQGSFQDSEVVVLDDRHLAADFRRTYNEHVIFG